MKYIIYAMAAMFFWLRAAKTMMKPAVVTAVEEKPEE